MFEILMAPRRLGGMRGDLRFKHCPVVEILDRLTCINIFYLKQFCMFYPIMLYF